jgi:deoxyribonuclease V
MTGSNLSRIQEELAKRVEIPHDDLGYQVKQSDIIFSLDAQYSSDQAYVALDVREWNGKIQGTYVGTAKVEVPYIPHFFCFREGPPLMEIINAARSRLSLQPDLIIVDGHGIAHPKRFGLACWIGVSTNTPAIGCAKETLVWYDGELEKTRGNHLYIRDNNDIVGAVLVTQNNTRPVFVSSGHRVSLKTAMEVVLHLSCKYRISEPLRRADQSARAYAKGIILEGVTPLGELT